ncbi:SsrA-binding protein [Novimethylophilus kurashikiensis]|uniref:SsrA-binding protein n=1 Tax=Novimethylophilus kurashikiensis TaxID=1825523 RepID=A0A2R5F7S4_9PROT|nr:SsrA-binding protein SmpB [Novimethylophilus kurashikiensis]GBG14266.1 SsrA-binding protein [Novimethylophilus kurashikiensis]
METIAENRQARHNYHIEDTFLAGMVLEGWEVKSILAGRGNFGMGGAFIAIRDGEAFLEGTHLTPDAHVQRNALNGVSAVRTRKLLLNRSELNKLQKKVVERGYTIVPLEVQREGAGRKLKLLIGLAKGKKQYDKRADQKARDLERAGG